MFNSYIKTVAKDSEFKNQKLDIARIPKQNIRFVERSNEHPTTESSDLVALKDYLSAKVNALEAKTKNVQVVSTDYAD